MIPQQPQPQQQHIISAQPGAQVFVLDGTTTTAAPAEVPQQPNAIPALPPVLGLPAGSPQAGAPQQIITLQPAAQSDQHVPTAPPSFANVQILNGGLVGGAPEQQQQPQQQPQQQQIIVLNTANAGANVAPQQALQLAQVGKPLDVSPILTNPQVQLQHTQPLTLQPQVTTIIQQQPTSQAPMIPQAGAMGSGLRVEVGRSLQPSGPAKPHLTIHGDVAFADGDDTNLIVNYIPADYEDADLEALFSSAGPVRGARVITDGQRGARGYGFVRMTELDGAIRALQTMAGVLVNNKRLKVNIARPTGRVVMRQGHVVDLGAVPPRQEAPPGGVAPLATVEMLREQQEYNAMPTCGNTTTQGGANFVTSIEHVNQAFGGKNKSAAGRRGKQHSGRNNNGRRRSNEQSETSAGSVSSPRTPTMDVVIGGSDVNIRQH